MPAKKHHTQDVETEVRHMTMESVLKGIVHISKHSSTETWKDCCVAVEQQGKEKEYLEALDIAIPWLTHLRDTLKQGEKLPHQILGVLIHHRKTDVSA